MNKTMVLEESTDNNANGANKRTRFVLTKVFTFALISVICIFVVVKLLAFSRLIDFRASLVDISEKSVPNMIFSGRVFTEVNTLIYLTESLSKPSSKASLQVVEREIDLQLDKLQLLADHKLADPYLSVQLNALRIELAELRKLVEKSLQVNNQLTAKLQDIYQVYSHKVNVSELIDKHPRWSLLVADTLAMTGKLNTMSHIYSIRAVADQMALSLQQLDQIAATANNADQAFMRSVSAVLNTALLGREGIIELSVEQLKIDGRVRGRGNFVRNVILDYANLAEYHSYEVNESIVAKANMTTKEVDEQIKLVGFISILALLFLLAVVLFLQTKFIHRLKLLDKLVRQHLDGKEPDVQLRGNDEISDIANTFTSFVAKIEYQNEILQNLSLSDGLTGIANRRALDERLLYTLNFGQRNALPTSVLLLDVDYFKRYNDKYGHAKGDDCLVEVATILTAAMKRDNDFVARYGGEEFVCVLGDTDEEGAKQVAENIIAAMAQSKIPHGDSLVSDFVSLSIGAVTYFAGQEQKADPLELLKQADKALYQAKENGRNTYVAAIAH